MRYKVIFWLGSNKKEIYVGDLLTAYTIADGFDGIVLNVKAVAR